MGMYDEVILRCPDCGEEYFAQSKGGQCCFDLYDIENAPADVLSDVNRHAPFECNCGCIFDVEFMAIERKLK